jgi:hypothetical protein
VDAIGALQDDPSLQPILWQPAARGGICPGAYGNDLRQPVVGPALKAWNECTLNDPPAPG